MEIIEIDKKNVDDIGYMIPPDVSENIGRQWYRGLVSDNASAGIVWEYKNANDDEADTTSEIVWASGDDKEVLEALLASYHINIMSESAVRSDFEMSKDSRNETLKSALYEDRFKIENLESRDIYVTVGDFSRLKLKKNKTPFYIRPLEEVEYRKFKNGVIDCVFEGKKGLLEDLAWISPDWFDEEISSCVVMDEIVKGFLLIHRTATGILIVELLFSSGIEPRKYLLEMIKFSIRAAIKKYPPDTKILLRRHNSAVQMLVKKMFPDKKGDEVMACSRQEIGR